MKKEKVQKSTGNIATAKKGIKAKLMQLVCVSIAAGILLTIAAVTVLNMINTTKETYTTLDQLGTSYASEINNTIDLAWSYLETFAASSSYVDHAKKAADGNISQEEMAAYLADLDEGTIFDSISLLFADGSTWDGYDLSARDYVQAAQAGHYFINSGSFSTRDNVLQYFCVIPMNDGVVNGIAFAPINGSYFANAMMPFVDNSNHRAQFFVLDPTGKFVVHSDMAKVEEGLNAIDTAAESSTYTALVASMVAGNTGTQSVTLDDGQRYLASYRPVGNDQGWTLCLLYNTADVYRNTFITLVVQLGLALLLIILDYFIANRRSTTLVKPIEAINDRLKLLAKGDTHSTLDIPVKKVERELGELVDSLEKTISGLNGYIADISDVLSYFAAGDFSQGAQIEYAGDFMAIQQSLKAIQIQLSGSFKAIFDCTNAVKGNSDVVASSSQGMAQGATEQASAIDGLANTIAGIAEQASDSAAKADEVRSLTNDNKLNVKNSLECMSQMQQAMGEISVNSEQISKIVKTINDIAFQTNILALNAAVEAARAGQQGKGFAVVAEEVRSLATKSAEAANETQRLVYEAISSVENGTNISEQMNNSLALVTEKNDTIANKIQEIADAAGRQSASIEQVNVGIEQISVVVQSNTATAEETAAASSELNNQAEVLKDTVMRFKFK